MTSDIIKRRRKEMGITQAQLAEELGVSRSLVAHLESGRRDPSDELSVKLSRVLHVSLEALFTELEELPVDLIEHFSSNRTAFRYLRFLLLRVYYGKELNLEMLQETLSYATQYAKFLNSKSNEEEAYENIKDFLQYLRIRRRQL